jgi:phosphate transport system protein
MQTRGHYDSDLTILQNQLHEMSVLVIEAVTRSVEAIYARNPDLARRVVEEDPIINQHHRLIEDHAVTIIATQQPVARDLRRIVAAIAISSELERIADYAKGIARLELEGTAAPGDQLIELADAARQALHQVLAALYDQDAEAAQTLAEADNLVDAIYRDVKTHLLKRLDEVEGTPARVANLLFIAHILERIADRATNIAEQVIYIVHGAVPELNP